MKIERIKKRISKKSKKGFQGYPVLTIAYYGPDAKLATKVAVGFIKSEDDDVIMERYYSDADVRTEESIQEKIAGLIEKLKPKTVSVIEQIMGCPHEEGKDYPNGESCPKCTYWKGRDRFTGEILQ